MAQPARHIQEQHQQMRQNIQQHVDVTKKSWDVHREEYEPQRDSSYHRTQYSSHRFLYWMGLAFLLVINFMISIVLLPLLLIMKGMTMYVLVAGLGLLFGVIFDFLVKDLEHLEKNHHLFAGLIIPVIAIFNFFIISFVAKNVSRLLDVTIVHSPLIASSLYILVFMGPFAYSLLITKEIN